MSALLHIFRLIVADQKAALARGALLGILVLAMGAALLGLSGWFITAAAAAGLAGLGTVFDVFRPSAMVRMLALGRAAARYGERLLTHEATLRALESLRLRLLSGYLAASYQRMLAVRGPQALNRLMADIDALDGVPLRLVLPVASALAVQALAGLLLWWLVTPGIALWITLGWLCGAALVLVPVLMRAAPQARRREAAAQAFRARFIDLIRARRDLAIHGELQAQAARIAAADDRRFAVDLDRIERGAGFSLSLVGTLVAAGTLYAGISAVQAGRLEPAFAALAFLAAVALGETVAPLRRAAADLGRMAEAARRVRRDLAAAPQAGPDPAPLPAPAIRPDVPDDATTARLTVEGLSLARPGRSEPLIESLTLSVAPGETVALTGPSGCGKSTVLLAASGLLPAKAGEIRLLGHELALWPEPELRRTLALLPQRSALMAGTLAEALRLAAPDVDEARLWQVLEAVELQALVRERGGLSARLGPRGEGFSGGEGRRLALARVLLRQPKMLLLDEPTEGLDQPTAEAVLAGIRAVLPQAAILMASHRAAERAFADRLVALP
ncbi:ATP-binding cassette domain-containing protein [Rhizobium sp. CSW-27]|uniref:amino acid ABC transporter ATP-binding/permease protein n=1 Tax=Rhizobium sp. CSW-27 TaxID=2839985 RepID=UPI001C00A7BA|nr:ATP-binding cassette domain-containing protein [Rhizobium sp. CSW-27]MBT9372331.1 ATP-binding cassette domain-containing protein [Rhizobium sp. CSW-27]